MNKQIVIIGGGIGGLTAGALLAAEGLPITVLEASREWGGCAGKFRRKDFLYPVGATLGMGFEPGGIHDRILKHLGINVEAQRLNEVMEVHLPGKTFIFKQDREEHVQQFCAAYPKYEAALRGFYREVFQMAGEIRKLMGAMPILPPSTVKEWLELVWTVKPTTLAILPKVPLTVADLLRKYQLDSLEEFVHFLDGQLIDSMQTTSAHTVLLLGALSLDIYHEGAYYLEGGLYRVAEELVRSIEENGGDLRLGKRAVTIEKQGGRWVVHDQYGNPYSADEVVCNTPVSALKGLMPKPIYDNLSSRLRSRAHSGPWGSFNLYLAVKNKVIPENTPLFQQILGNEKEPLTQGNHLFISLSAADDRLRSPEGYRTINVSTHVPLGEWHDQGDYQEKKTAMVEKMLTGLEKLLPAVRQGIVEMIPGSPKAWERFLCRPRGEVGGFPQAREFALFRALSHRSGVPGLWLCGDSIFPGAGTIGASMSGYHVFHSLSGKQLR